MKILVVAAHPDDEVLGCGATIAGFADIGHEIKVVILGEGITSRNEMDASRDEGELSALQASSRRALAKLGVTNVVYFDLPDNRFDTVPLLKITKSIEKIIAEHTPEVVFTHHHGDLNYDHVLTARAVLTATRPAFDCPVREILSFEIPSSTEWSFAKTGGGFHPNVFYDVTKTLHQKVAAMAEYESEARTFPHPRSPEALSARARTWGSVVGAECVEAFELIRSIR